MTSRVRSIKLKPIDLEAPDALSEILKTPEEFHGTGVEQETAEIEVKERKYQVVKRDGEGKVGPWTEIELLVDADETPVNLLIALDCSYSMNTLFDDATRFDIAVEGILSIFERKAKYLTAGTMTYGTDWEMTLDVTRVKDFTKKRLTALEKELKETRLKGKAAAGSALSGAVEVFNVKGLKDIRAVVLITDGIDEVGTNPIKEAENLVSRGIHIYPFYLGDESDEKSLKILKYIAALSHTRLFTLYNAVEQEKRRIIRESLRNAEEQGEDAEEQDEEEIEVPSGAELLKKELGRLGGEIYFLLQTGSEGPETGEDEEVQVIKAGVPSTEEEREVHRGPVFERTPKIIDAIKHFIDWLKSIIW